MPAARAVSINYGPVKKNKKKLLLTYRSHCGDMSLSTAIYRRNANDTLELHVVFESTYVKHFSLLKNMNFYVFRNNV